MRSRLLCLLLALTCVTGPMGTASRAEQPGDAMPPTLTAAIDKKFAAFDRRDSAGCALGIYQDGRIRYARGYGMADVGRGEPLSATTVFEVASITKQFVAGVVGLLAEQRVLALDEDVRKYVPEMPDFGARITLDQLIHHTSGIPDFPAYQAVTGVRTPDTVEAQLTVLGKRAELDFTPGSAFSYKNIEYNLLRLVAERATHQTAADLFAARIWGPLGMSRTAMRNRSDAPPPGVAIGHRLEDGRLVPIERRPAGSVFTSVADLQRWDENFYTGAVGGAAWVRRMVSPTRLSDGTPSSYGFGNWIGTYRGLPVVRHDGIADGYRTYLIRFPTRHASVAILCNVESARPVVLAHDIADLLLAGTFPDGDATKPQQNPERAERWAGLYVDVLRGGSREVVADGTNLRVAYYGDPTFVPLSRTRFRNRNGSVELSFTIGRGGAVTMEQQFPIGGEAETFARVAPWAPAPSELADFAGTYENAALAATHRISATADGLSVQLPGEPTPRPFKPLTKDIFEHPRLSVVQFTRDREGRVTGYVVHLPRAWRIPFTRSGQ